MPRDTPRRKPIAPGPDENISRFNAGLARLRRRSNVFLSRWQSGAFAQELGELLGAIEAARPEPREGVALVARFFEHDRHAFDKCDDSDGAIGEVFKISARQLFARFATACTDKNFVADTMLRLVADNGYGVRDPLFVGAAQFLPEANLRALVDKLWKKGTAPGEKTHRSELRLVEVLARELKDAPLFEKTRRLGWKNLNAAACHDIARAYLEAGDPNTALAWLERVPPDDTFFRRERDTLALAVHTQLGNREGAAAVAWQMFRADRCADTLADLLEVIGADQRRHVIDETIAELAAANKLDVTGAQFLADMDQIDDAEAHVVKHAAALNGDAYLRLLPLADCFQDHGHWLGASLLYRALLDSILRRAYAKSYNHAAKYLRKLDVLAGHVADWRGHDDHARYKQAVRKAHALKRSFWERYGG